MFASPSLSPYLVKEGRTCTSGKVALLKRRNQSQYLMALQITVIPNLTSGCTEFVESAEHILEKRKMNQTLLANRST